MAAASKSQSFFCCLELGMPKGLFKEINNCILPIHALSPPSARGVVFAGALGQPELSVGISGARLPTALGLRGGKPHCILPPSHEDVGVLVGAPSSLSAIPCPSNPEELADTKQHPGGHHTPRESRGGRERGTSEKSRYPVCTT